MNKILSQLLLLVLPILVSQISPNLRKEIEAAIKKMEEKAKETASPFDDIFVGVLKTLLQIP